MKDENYIKQIDSLIPQAKAIADKVIRKNGGKETEHRRGADGNPYAFCLWSEQFHFAMRDLTREAGLRNC